MKKYFLSKPSQRIMNFGLTVICLEYLYVLGHIYLSEVPMLTNVALMLEHINSSLVLIVAGALILDIHIKKTI